MANIFDLLKGKAQSATPVPAPTADQLPLEYVQALLTEAYAGAVPAGLAQALEAGVDAAIALERLPMSGAAAMGVAAAERELAESVEGALPEVRELVRVLSGGKPTAEGGERSAAASQRFLDAATRRIQAALDAFRGRLEQINVAERASQAAEHPEAPPAVRPRAPRA